MPFFSGPRPITRPLFRHSAPWNSSKPHCHICHKQGHTVDTCCHRYDPPIACSITANISQSSISVGDDYAPSILGAPSTIKDPLGTPIVMLPTMSLATHLFFTTNYHSSESLKVGNDQGMNIIHTSSTFYIAPHTHIKFLLHHLLHVPHITKNFISVAQFTKENNVYFEFYPHSCFVKHQDTHQILIQGIVRYCLYVFPSSPDSLSYTANHASYKPNVPPLQL